MPAALFDSSAWLAAVFPTHPLHAQAQATLAAATVAEPAFLCRATQTAFLRLITTPSILRLYSAEHMTNRAALTLLQMLLARPQIAEIEEPPGTVTLWQRLAARDTASPRPGWTPIWRPLPSALNSDS